MSTAFKAYSSSTGVSKSNPKAFSFEGRNWSVQCNKDGEPTGVNTWIGKGYSVSLPASVIGEIATKEFAKVAEEAAAATVKAIKSGDLARNEKGYY